MFRRKKTPATPTPAEVEAAAERAETKAQTERLRANLTKAHERIDALLERLPRRKARLKVVAS